MRRLIALVALAVCALAPPLHGQDRVDSTHAARTKATLAAIRKRTTSSTIRLQVDSLVAAENALLTAHAPPVVTPPPPPPPPANSAPIARFTAACAGLVCQMDASGSTDDRAVVSYRWAWGDGRSETHSGPTARNTWGAAGTYTVTLVVSDSAGLTGSASQSLALAAAAPPPVTPPDTAPTTQPQPPPTSPPPVVIPPSGTIAAGIDPHPYAPLSNGATYAVLPMDSVSLVVPAPTRTIAVGASLQAAYDTARTGDLLKLPPAKAYPNPQFNNNARVSWVTITGSDSTSVIEGTIGGATSAVNIGPGAHHIRFLGPLTIRAATDATNAIVRSFNGETSRAQLAHDIIYDGITVTSNGYSVRRCMWPDGVRIAVVRSRLLGCSSKAQSQGGPGGDAQGIENAQGGPYRYQNNYIEASHQCYMAGGAAPSIAGDAASDVWFSDNQCVKPLYWHFAASGTYTGVERQVKTVIETKSIRRGLFERNLVKNVWADAQAGFAGLFKTEDPGGDPTAQSIDITVRYNHFSNVAGGINIAARPTATGKPLTRLTAYDNTFDGLSTKAGEGICLQILDAVTDVVLMHNTFANCGNNAVSLDGTPGTRTSLVANVIPTGAYGVKAGGMAIGDPSVARFISLFLDNAIVGADCSQYKLSPTTTCTATPKTASDGKPVGANAALIPY